MLNSRFILPRDPDVVKAGVSRQAPPPLTFPPPAPQIPPMLHPAYSGRANPTLTCDGLGETHAATHAGALVQQVLEAEREAR